MKTILVPTDFSKDADNACRYAIAIAKEAKARLILMHTFETPVLYSSMPLVSANLSFGAIHDNEWKKLQKYYEKIKKLAEDVSIELVLQQGLASSRIAEIALEKKADLIVMGSTGKDALERVVMGSNTRRVIHVAPCMVLAVPPKAKFKGLKKIVYATDLMDDNLQHAKTMLQIARIFDSDLLFLKVNTHIFSGNDTEELKQLTARIKKYIRYPNMSGHICNDRNIVKGIHYFLDTKKVDCLAMYTHHRNILRMLFGTGITDKMAVHNTIPLLVLHEKDYVDESTGL